MDSTKAQALDAALANIPPVPYSAPSLASALGDPVTSAQTFGRWKRLQCTDGSWMCWGCGVEYEPFDVSLHCPSCLQDARERRVARLLAEARRSPEDRRWEGMAMAIAKDSRMTRELAVELIKRARELPSVTTPRVQALNMAFDRRFERPAPGANWGTYTGEAESDPAEEWTRE